MPEGGRVFTDKRVVGPQEATASRRARLDAIVSWLQEIAYADMVDADLHDERTGWLVRRMLVRVERFPRFGELVTLSTFASGLGPMWAERRTSLVGANGGHVEAEAIWVVLDTATAKPRRVGQGYDAVFGSATNGRRVHARLRHQPPPEALEPSRWRFRAADLDVAGHVNNAAYWQVLEEGLTELPAEATLTVELEHRNVAGPGLASVLRDGDGVWILNPEGEVAASARVLHDAEG